MAPAYLRALPTVRGYVQIYQIEIKARLQEDQGEKEAGMLLVSVNLGYMIFYSDRIIWPRPWEAM